LIILRREGKEREETEREERADWFLFYTEAAR
jgi:hypothetical protein